MRYYTQIEDSNFEEILNIIEKETEKFVNEVKKVSYVSNNAEIQELLCEESLTQILSIVKALQIPIKEATYENNKSFDLGNLFVNDNTNKNKGRLMQLWITLGSALESLLQVFLAAYLKDYKSSNWGKWQNFKVEEVKEKLLETLNDLKDEGLIYQKQKDSFKKDIKKYLKNKQEITALHDLSLQSLINFYINFFWSEDKKVKEINEKLNFIRENRNCVHSFKSRKIGDWSDLLDSLKFFVTVIIDLRCCIPDVDEVIDLEMQMRREIDRYYIDCYSDFND